ncbi:MAG: four helix bundle protein [Stagnimonas sp.]|nr:four helix bundle protein [Stagnimonas sp.]
MGTAPPLKDFRELRVWQAAMQLVTAVYRLTSQLPASEQYGLISQMRRASVSVPSNIAEGYCRESVKDYLRLLVIAQGSLAELETQIEVAERLEYWPAVEAGQLLSEAQSVARLLRALRNSLLPLAQ